MFASGRGEGVSGIYLDYGGKKHLAVHGHQFDRFIVNNILLSHVGTFLHLVLQKLDLKGKPFAPFCGSCEYELAAAFPRRCVRGRCCKRGSRARTGFSAGYAEAMHREKDGVEYYNTGSWTIPS